ncbi:MAG: DUF551 domain-containing protein [Lachnospiraceae bacterium]|nr:DUF551 domain-containing protein [Lachnospiraceae bacterium]
MINEINLIKRFKELQGVDTLANMFISDVIKIIKKEPKVGEWIPCSERLPEEGQRVLATHDGGLNHNLQVIEHVFKNGEFLGNWDMDTDFKSPTFGQRYMGDVIAWQPLPEPYGGN